MVRETSQSWNADVGSSTNRVLSLDDVKTDFMETASLYTLVAYVKPLDILDHRLKDQNSNEFVIEFTSKDTSINGGAAEKPVLLSFKCPTTVTDASAVVIKQTPSKMEIKFPKSSQSTVGSIVQPKSIPGPVKNGKQKLHDTYFDLSDVQVNASAVEVNDATNSDSDLPKIPFQNEEDKIKARKEEIERLKKEIDKPAEVLKKGFLNSENSNGSPEKKVKVVKKSTVANDDDEPEETTAPQKENTNQYISNTVESGSGKLVRAGFVGLVNKENTCYMNSVLQVLASCPEFLQFCLKGFTGSELVPSNPISSQGKITKLFVELVRELWSYGTSWYVHPSLMIRACAKNFQLFVQHDAHEFLAYILDMLHEDMNANFAYRSPSDEQDAKCADEAWGRYLRRNRSPIVDWFHGQIRSLVTCSHCGEHSATFDPFAVLQLPIPPPPTFVYIYIAFVPYDTPMAAGVYITAKLPNNWSISQLKRALRKQLKVKDEIVAVTLDQSVSQLEDYWKLSDLDQDKVVFLLQLPPYVSATNGLGCAEKTGDCPGEDGDEKPANGNASTQHPSYLIVTQHVASTLAKSSQCSHCGIKSSTLQRCSRCQAAAYCNATCQNSDWSKHRQKCRQFTSEPVGVPFVVSTPKRVRQSVKKFKTEFLMHAKRSVTFSCSDKAAPDHNHFDIKVGESDDVVDAKQLKEKGGQRSGFARMYWRNERTSPCGLNVEPLPWQAVMRPLNLAVDQTTLNPQFVSLTSCIKTFTNPEFLRTTDAWHCPRCQGKRTAVKQLSVSRLPDNLVIQLKRFSHTAFMLKNRTRVDIPLAFRFDPDHLTDECKSTFSNGACYALYGVVTHRGSLQYGHYTSLVRRVEPNAPDLGWRFCDDEEVESVKESAIDTGDAYLLFYHRTDEEKFTSIADAAVPMTDEFRMMNVGTAAAGVADGEKGASVTGGFDPSKQPDAATMALGAKLMAGMNSNHNTNNNGGEKCVSGGGGDASNSSDEHAALGLKSVLKKRNSIKTNHVSFNDEPNVKSIGEVETTNGSADVQNGGSAQATTSNEIDLDGID